MRYSTQRSRRSALRHPPPARAQIAPYLWAVALIEFAASRRTESDTALQELIAKYQTHSAYQAAEVYGARGDADLAFDWLERAYVQRDGGLTDVKISRHLRPLRADPRCDAFLRKMGIAG